jgi:hypothetical protein
VAAKSVNEIPMQVQVVNKVCVGWVLGVIYIDNGTRRWDESEPMALFQIVLVRMIWISILGCLDIGDPNTFMI